MFYCMYITRSDLIVSISIIAESLETSDEKSINGNCSTNEKKKQKVSISISTNCVNSSLDVTIGVIWTISAL